MHNIMPAGSNEGIRSSFLEGCRKSIPRAKHQVRNTFDFGNLRCLLRCSIAQHYLPITTLGCLPCCALLSSTSSAFQCLTSNLFYTALSFFYFNMSVMKVETVLSILESQPGTRIDEFPIMNPSVEGRLFISYQHALTSFSLLAFVWRCCPKL